MSDYYEERKRTSAFSWREFAKIAGFTSPTYLKLVCEGKSNLSKVTMGRVARAMGLAGHEETYFEVMVQFGNARKDDQKKKFLEQMQSMALSHKVRVVDKDAFEYYETWKNSVVRELAPMMPGAMPGEIAKMCTQEVSALEVRKSLQFLERAGFLKQTDPSVTFPRDSSHWSVRGISHMLSAVTESSQASRSQALAFSVPTVISTRTPNSFSFSTSRRMRAFRPPYRHPHPADRCFGMIRGPIPCTALSPSAR